MKKLALILASYGLIGSALACTTIIVGKDASDDGSILVARNVDGSSDSHAVRYVYHPARSTGYLYQGLSNQFSLQLPNQLLAYSGVPYWDKQERGYEEVGYNSLGVGISATETIFSNPATLKLDPYLKSTGVTEEAIPTVILPQIHSAREGVLLLGKIIEEHGSAEGFGVAFVDQHEAWYLENAGGHRWAAVRIPDNAYFVSANQSRIGTINLVESTNYLGSADLISFATSHGLYKPQQGPFNFHQVYGKNDSNDVTYNYKRVASLQASFTPKSAQQSVSNGNFPMFLTPAHKLSLNEVESGLRIYYAGTDDDPYTRQNPHAKYRPVAVYRTQQSHILQVRNQLPPALAHVEYLALGMTALTVYVPFYQGATVPLSYSIATNQADDNSAYWRFRKLQMLTMLNFPVYAPIVQQRFEQLNTVIQTEQKQFEQRYLALYPQQPAQAQKLLDNFTATTVQQVFDCVDQLTNQLVNLQSKQINQLYHFEGA